MNRKKVARYFEIRQEHGIRQSSRATNSSLLVIYTNNVFFSDINDFDEQKIVNSIIIGKYNLYYDRALGLMIEEVHK